MLSGQERTKAFLEEFIQLTVRNPEKVKVEVREAPHQHTPNRILTTFTVQVEEQRDAAILIGVGGKNIQTLRDVVHVIASQQGFAPARVEIIDPLRSRDLREPRPRARREPERVGGGNG